ncbi:MAG: aminopeptidase P family protein [Alphaproteobacteria bacterium]|nr:aminopeptidase P family protein [Alphaproteobacteria bacterium]
MHDDVAPVPESEVEAPPPTPVAAGSRDAVAARLAALRAELSRRELAGFVVPLADEHQGEYLPASAQRLAWLTGFTGSAGYAVVLADAAAIFVDGRYTLQARDQVPADLFTHRHLTEEPLDDWLKDRLAAGARLGHDPWLHTPVQVERLRKAVEAAGGVLVAAEGNPVDAVWPDRPAPPVTPAIPHPLVFAGVPAADKRVRIGDAVAAAGADAAVLSAPDSIAWLLNVRGADVPCTPFVLSFAVVHRDARVDWFVDARKLSPDMAAHLGNGVAVRPPDSFGAELDAVVRGGARVMADPASAPAWVFDRIAAAGGTAVRHDDPCQLPKACKNPIEIAGTRAAHRRDAVALVRFLAWIARHAPSGEVDELAAVARLAALRAESDMFRGPSFETISGSGPNGAIVHYRATPQSNRRLQPGELYLVDSGGQYPDGTTDVTRTVAVGTPTAEMRDRFTRVLKGHIALAMCVFPKGTPGGQLDALARAALWQAGLDFDHGTGHGVGSYLSVHEGPQRISRAAPGAPLQPGMIVSNEPGFYAPGAFGIRIENLVTVIPVDFPGGRSMLGFETLTLAPIDRALVDPALLAPAERAWLDAYHGRVRSELTPRVDAETAAWLAEATRPLDG